MVELPSLWDRISGPTPTANQTSYATRMRAILMRDLASLLSTIKLGSIRPLDRWPHIETSGLNYGVQDVSGVIDRDSDFPYLERSVREAIVAFEPRLDPNNLQVTFKPTPKDGQREVARLQIKGRVRLPDSADPILLEAQINFDTGEIDLREGEA